jgi:hypothetical protein
MRKYTGTEAWYMEIVIVITPGKIRFAAPMGQGGRL